MRNVQNVRMEFFSPRELARTVGVSESSIKRWVDSGRIATTLTAGGHRRISLAEAMRFIRRDGIRPEQPERLGLPSLQLTEAPDERPVEERLYDDLRNGRAEAAIALVESLFMAGREVSEIVDGPFRAALARLGELWQDDAIGIYWEHRATQICVRALHRLRALQAPRPSAKLTALGGAQPGDNYVLPSLAVATVLESHGVAATDLGPETPIDALGRAMEEQRPDIVWLSVTATVSDDLLNERVTRLLDWAERVDAVLLIGGREINGRRLPDHPQLFRGNSMAELVAFVRGRSSAS